MRCPFCGENHDKVIDSRPADGGRVIRRRRECTFCSRRFTTREQVEDGYHPMVVKRSGAVVAYDRAKLDRSLALACHKRPISDEQREAMVVAIEGQLFDRGDREVRSSEIALAAAALLKPLDAVAYVRYVTLCEGHVDLAELLAEVQATPRPSKPKPRGQGTLF